MTSDACISEDASHTIKPGSYLQADAGYAGSAWKSCAIQVTLKDTMANITWLGLATLQNGSRVNVNGLYQLAWSGHAYVACLYIWVTWNSISGEAQTFSNTQYAWHATSLER